MNKEEKELVAMSFNAFAYGILHVIPGLISIIGEKISDSAMRAHKELRSSLIPRFDTNNDLSVYVPEGYYENGGIHLTPY